MSLLNFLCLLLKTRLTSNIPPYGQSLITMTQLKAVSSYDYPETDYYQEEVYDYTEEYIYEGTLIVQYFICGNSVQFS